MPTSMTDSECATMAPNFCSFFSDKVEHIRVSIRSMCCGQHFPPREFSGQPLTSFGTVTTTELIKLISKMPNKSSPLDVLLISLLKSCSDIFAPIVAHLASLSFEQGHFPEKFELAQVLPLLKKPGADCFLPVNYRPISNLSMISKLIERLVHTRLMPHLLSLGNFNPLQSAYRTGHSTETALLRVLDDIYKSIDNYAADNCGLSRHICSLWFNQWICTVHCYKGWVKSFEWLVNPSTGCVHTLLTKDTMSS